MWCLHALFSMLVISLVLVLIIVRIFTWRSIEKPGYWLLKSQPILNQVDWLIVGRGVSIPHKRNSPKCIRGTRAVDVQHREA